MCKVICSPYMPEAEVRAAVRAKAGAAARRLTPARLASQGAYSITEGGIDAAKD